MNYLTMIMTNPTNYTVVNINNIYNFLHEHMLLLTEEERKKYIKSMRLHIGMSFTHNFKTYIFSKMADSPLLSSF